MNETAHKENVYFTCVFWYDRSNRFTNEAHGIKWKNATQYTLKGGFTCKRREKSRQHTNKRMDTMNGNRYFVMSSIRNRKAAVKYAK